MVQAIHGGGVMQEAEEIDVVILGGPGDGMVVAQALRDRARASGRMRLRGFLNDALSVGTTVAGAPVLGLLDSWRELPQAVRFVPALHKVGEMTKRIRRIFGLGIPDHRWTSIVHPTACIADDVAIGFGSFIASHVTVQPGAALGHFVSVRAGANIGHDATLEDFAYMGPNSTLAGRARMGLAAHLGPNAVVIDRIEVGSHSIVGAGAAVMKHAEAYSVYLGNPARRLRGLARE